MAKILESETRRAINELKREKAAGSDRMTNEVVKVVKTEYTKQKIIIRRYRLKI